jgi:hypothetical protein
MGVTEVDRLLFTIVLLSAAFLVMFLLAAIVERAYEVEERRRRYRPRIPKREQDLLGEDWRDRAGRWSR